VAATVGVTVTGRYRRRAVAVLVITGSHPAHRHSKCTLTTTPSPQGRQDRGIRTSPRHRVHVSIASASRWPCSFYLHHNVLFVPEMTGLYPGTTRGHHRVGVDHHPPGAVADDLVDRYRRIHNRDH